VVEIVYRQIGGFSDRSDHPYYREYVLINSDRLNVECYRLNEREKWELTVYSAEAITIELKSVDLAFPLAMVYEDREFDRSTDA
jgi:Uma2 family endonuclease